MQTTEIREIMRRAGVTRRDVPGKVASDADITVCHLIGSLAYGGAERQVVNLLNHLPFKGRSVLVLRSGLSDNLTSQLSPGIDVYVTEFRIRTALLGIVRIARLLRDRQVDVLHTHMFMANLVGALAGRLAGVPVIVTSEHGRNLWKTRLHRWLERRVISPLVDKRICASEDILSLRERADGVPAAKLKYIPNGTSLPESIARQERNVPVLGAVGRLVEAKDYEGLIAAVGALHARGVDFRLCVVGDGPERRRIERAIAAHGVGQKVHLVGFQSDVPSWMRTFDVFVMSSIREGQPLALLEAMAHGLPVVATSVGGIPSTVTNGSEALLVSPRDSEALAAALKQLLTDTELRSKLGANARRRVEQEFSIEAVAAKHAELYRQLWNAKHESDA